MSKVLWVSAALAATALGLSGASTAQEGDPGLTAALVQTPISGFALNLSAEQAAPARLNEISPPAPEEEARPRSLQLEFAAPQESTGMPLDFSLAQRASIATGEGGDINLRNRGAEVRIGAFGDPQSGMSQKQSRFYVFAASDDEALTWRPGQQSRALAMQQGRVEVGDRQAGLTYEHGPVQASLAYVEREVSATVGLTTTTSDENFAGLTVTMRH